MEKGVPLKIKADMLPLAKPLAERCDGLESNLTSRKNRAEEEKSRCHGRDISRNSSKTRTKLKSCSRKKKFLSRGENWSSERRVERRKKRQHHTKAAKFGLVA